MSQKWNKAEDILWPLNQRGVEAINYNFDQIFLALRVSPLGKGVLPVVNGGTNSNSFTAGDVLYASDTEHVVGLHDVATGNVLISGGVGAAPSFGKVQLAGPPQHVTGTLPAANGGTGISSYTIGDLLYASGATTLSKLADAVTGNALISGGVGAAPSWGKIGLTTHVSGILPPTNGGTGFATYAVGDLLYADTTASLARLADVATGNALISGGTSTAPAWGKIGLTTHVTGVLPTANGGTALSSYNQGDLLYASAANTLAALAKSTTATRYLSNTGASNAPAWAQVDLTNGVTGILPQANGGTGKDTSGATDGQLLIGKSSDHSLNLATLTAGANITITNGAGAITIAASGSSAHNLLDGSQNQDTLAHTVVRGDLIVGNSTPKWAALALGAANRVLRSDGTDPSWAQVSLTTDVTGTLGVTLGGTGLSSIAQGDLLYGSASNTLSALAKNASATRYLSNTGASNNPAWAQVDLSNGVTGQLPIANGGTAASSASSARTNLGLGTMATQNANAVAITGGSSVGQDMFQVTGASAPASGAGLEFVYSAPFGIMQAYDRGAAVYKSIVLSGTDLTIQVHVGGGGGSNATTWASDGTLNHTNALRLSGSISPSALASGLTHNYAPTSLHTTYWLRATPNAANSTLTGLDAGTDGERHLISNIATGGGGIVYLSPNDTGSSAANRFLTDSNYSTLSPFPINPGASVEVQYDGTSSRWRVISAR